MDIPSYELVALRVREPDGDVHIKSEHSINVLQKQWQIWITHPLHMLESIVIHRSSYKSTSKLNRYFCVFMQPCRFFLLLLAQKKNIWTVQFKQCTQEWKTNHCIWRLVVGIVNKCSLHFLKHERIRNKSLYFKKSGKINEKSKRKP